jgi:alcohol dehydrogenase (cytochrome c)
LEPEDARHKVLKWATLTAARGDVVVFAWADGLIQACEPETGKVLWEVKSGLPLFGGLAIMGDAVYAVTRAGIILGLDLKTGKEVWRKDIGVPILSYPAATGNTLYVADWSGNVYAFVGE